MTRKSIAIATAVTLISVAAGCSSDAPTAPEVIGSLSINVDGLVSAVPNGGTVRLVRTDVNKDTMWTFQLPTSGSLTVPMALGTYRVTFEAPVSYVAPSPVQTVTVQQAVEATKVTFRIYLITGTLQLDADMDGVNGPPWPKDGGTVSLLRTDIDGQSPLKVTIPYDGAGDYFGNFELPPGTYSLSYSPPTGFALAAGAPDHVNVRVVPGALVFATFPVVSVPP